MPTNLDVLEALRVVIDPDLHQDIVSLGFVRDVTIDATGEVSFEVRLTTPACPVKDQLRDQAAAAASRVPGVTGVRVSMTAEVRGQRSRDATHAALADVAHVIAVTSGKGGVGKSTTTVNLAYALAAEGARVGIVDADVHGPSIVHLTGAEAPEDVGSGVMTPPEVGGVKIASMAMFVPAKRPMVLRGPRVAGVLQQLLGAFAWGELDYLLVDCPPGTGDVQLTLAQQVSLTGAVMVTTPQELALVDVRRAVGMLKMVDVPVLGIVETMSGFACPDCGSVHPIFASGGGQRLAEEYDVPLLGAVPLDPAVVADGDAGHPAVLAHPDSAASRAYVAAAKALAARVSVAAAAPTEALDAFSVVWERRP